MKTIINHTTYTAVINSTNKGWNPKFKNMFVYTDGQAVSDGFRVFWAGELASKPLACIPTSVNSESYEVDLPAVIPQNFSYSFDLTITKEFLTSLKTLAVGSQDAVNKSTLITFDKDLITFSYRNKITRELSIKFSETITTNQNFEPFEQAFNSEYLLDFLGAMEAGTIVTWQGNADKPALLSADGYSYLVADLK